MIFPDTSPRGLDFAEVNENKDWKIGYGAGHYCNATAAPWNKNFNMFTYVTEELP
jgi:S-formylglutathione hydrolase